jgi:hypothetical protein
MFSLNALQSLPANSEVSLGFPATLVPPSVEGNIRLDFCLDGGDLDFRRFVVMVRTRSGIRPFVHSIEKSFNSTALSAFIFGGKIEDFSITLPTKNSYVTEYRLQGWKVAGKEFVSLSSFISDGQQLKPESDVIVGTLDYGDFPNEGNCKSFEKYQTDTFAAGTATLSFGYCTFPAAGETRGFRITSVKAKDVNPKLTADQQKEFAFDEVALTSVLVYRFNHHNSCDAFTLRLPHAVYAATSSATFTMNPGHCAQFEEAPRRDPLEHGKVKWLVRYNGSESITGFGEVAHFLEHYR